MRSANSELKFEVSESFRDKHVMVDDRRVHDVPYKDILYKFKYLQRTGKIRRPYGPNERTRHSFLVVEPQSWPVALNALETEYKKQYERKNKWKNKRINKRKNNVQVPTPGAFLKNTIELNRLPFGVLDLQIEYQKNKQRYKVFNCVYPTGREGSLRLGALVKKNIYKHKTDYIFEINHLDDVNLLNTSTCKDWMPKIDRKRCMKIGKPWKGDK